MKKKDGEKERGRCEKRPGSSGLDNLTRGREAIRGLEDHSNNLKRRDERDQDGTEVLSAGY